MAPSRLLAAILLTTGLLSVATPARAAVDPGWTAPGYGPGNSFYNPRESVINGSSIGKVRLKWTSQLATTGAETCTGPSEPLVSGGRVFVTDQTGIGAYQQTTGRRLWHYTWSDPGDTNTPHLALSGGLLLAGYTECQSRSDPNGGIVALNVATGREKWSGGPSGPVESLVTDRGVVVVAGSSMSSEPQVSGYRVSDGRELWSIGEYWSPGISAGGRLLVTGGPAQNSAALSITTGTKLWSRALPYEGLAASPAGDAYYLADGDGGVLCVRSTDGAKLWWKNGTGGEIASDGTRVYRSFSSNVEALNARTGARLWITRLRTAFDQPVRAGGLLYTGSTILTAATGKPAATWKSTGDSTYPVLAGGWLLQITDNTIQGFAP
ncbi:PQQ-binding-like beta-propeller repeat protein [Actinoplanes sp. NPDC051494]|uniref:outer membrane protein assembly factor BamB family protein n=1 Tax=Actinoplanes sp. NPDC051494 TaxID=3363907 RepID=UPI00378EF063